jgi:glutamyl-tRNA reductase
MAEDNKDIASELGLTKINEADYSNVSVIQPVVSNDRELAKENIKEALDVVLPTFKDLAQVAKSAQHDRMYSALSGMLLSIVQANKALADIDTAEQKKTPDDVVGGNKTLNMFVGTPVDLQNMLDKYKK